MLYTRVPRSKLTPPALYSNIKEDLNPKNICLQELAQ